MKILYLDRNGNVRITKEGKPDKAFNDLYISDRREGKPFFKDAITYIYFVYDRDSIYKNLSLDDRKLLVCSNFIKDKKKDHIYFEKNKKISACIKRYIECLFTATDRLYIKLQDDIDKYITYLSEIPYSITKVIEVNVSLSDGTIQREKVSVEISNTNEKVTAIKASSNLVEYKKSLEDLIKNEELSDSQDLRRIFDKINDKS